ncbi:SRPBCC family protein [Rhodospirillaceae bacterium SYSU D60014]|uniref:aromatic ring-hydroxylating oxygenase subunit alpha n=1 Tax=Virgifigura deserti TaxID=2268457 RepID=UPI000E66D30B
MSTALPLTESQLASVRRPIAEASGLPNDAYVSDAYLRFERDYVLGRTWTCVGLGKDVPNLGDAVPVNLLGLPLLLLRDHEGRIKVFHNVCSHRGMELVSHSCRVETVLRCPYHSWAYDLDGRLRATPHIGGPGRNSCEGFDRARYGLKPVRTAVWLDMVFVTLSDDAPPFEAYAAPLAARWKDFDTGLIRHGGPDSSLRFEVNCNWKLAVENYCEAYHLPWVHPGLNSYSRLEDHYNIEAEGQYAGQGSLVYTPVLVEGGPPFPRFPDLPEKWTTGAEYVALFPNVLLGIHADHLFAMRLEPVAADRTVEHLDLYYVGDEPLGEDYAAMRAANAGAWRAVFEEDIGVVEGMQRGRASPAFGGGTFSPVMDGPTHCFHRWVAAKLSEGVGETGRRSSAGLMAD